MNRRSFFSRIGALAAGAYATAKMPIAKFTHGGIVKQRFITMTGETGPEQIIPLAARAPRALYQGMSKGPVAYALEAAKQKGDIIPITFNEDRAGLGIVEAVVDEPVVQGDYLELGNMGAVRKYRGNQLPASDVGELSTGEPLNDYAEERDSLF